MAARSLLFVTDQPPWPATTNGFTMRYHALLSALAERHAVELVVLPGDRADALDGDATLAPRLGAVRRIAPIRLPGALRALRQARFWAQYLSPASDPAICHRYELPELEDALAAAVAGRRFDVLVLASWKHAALARRLRERVACGRLVVDLIDSPALLVERDSFPEHRGAFKALETRRLRRLEREMARCADQLVYISRVDAEFANAAAPNVLVVPNGVAEDACAIPPERAGGGAIGFLGNMSYGPNVRAACWLAERVFARVRARHPGASLVVIGRDPAPAVRRLAALEGVTVTGTVESVAGYLRSMDLCAFPMFSGAGLQNKVLEAMAAGCPVVTTPIGNEGIDAKPGNEIVIAHDEDGFAREIGRLLAQPEEARRIAENGRAFARSRFSWGAAVAAFEAALDV